MTFTFFESMYTFSRTLIVPIVALTIAATVAATITPCVHCIMVFIVEIHVGMGSYIVFGDSSWTFRAL